MIVRATASDLEASPVPHSMFSEPVVSHGRVTGSIQTIGHSRAFKSVKQCLCQPWLSIFSANILQELYQQNFKAIKRPKGRHSFECSPGMFVASLLITQPQEPGRAVPPSSKHRKQPSRSARRLHRHPKARPSEHRSPKASCQPQAGATRE